MPHRLTTDITLDCPLDEVFAFFSDASNLEAITPPELRFRILTPLPIEMQRGRLIDYRLSLFGIPFSWRTEIAEWDMPHRFVDRQLQGPFALWEHEHRFEALSASRTRIRDEVRYALPLEPFGRLAHPIVRARLDHIFEFRTERVTALLGRRAHAA